MKGGITYASCKEIGGETSSQKSGACKESDSKEGSGEEGGEKGCFSGEKDRCQEIGRPVFATVVRKNRRRLISPPIFLGIKIEFAHWIGERQQCSIGLPACFLRRLSDGFELLPRRYRFDNAMRSDLSVRAGSLCYIAAPDRAGA